MTRPVWVNIAALGFAGLTLAALLALGTWQVQRLSWKNNLIAQVEARAFSAPVPAPAEAAPEYLRVTTHGTYRHDLSLRVKAVTEIGPGWWVMTPLETPDQTLWVNRGFVPTGLPETDWLTPKGPVDITGLARTSKPDGTWLEKNDPAANRWFSADLPEMSATSGITATTGYYIAADHTGPPAAFPRGGLTKVTFRNKHLSYAITWYAMAALLVAGLTYAIRNRRRA
ncbi:MAG: SURF1 family cytochrome oxidase biogenesis protein [Pseudomonadota bacterium]